MCDLSGVSMSLEATLAAMAGYLHGVVFDILVEAGWLGHGSRARNPATASARQRSPRCGLLGRSSLRERRLVGPAGLEPATRPL